ncbi:protein cornichon homolog 4-like [Xyrauchen texanus]|uniref:protein cornichon homolog 4-like n=1 Tax=Xyrauchen texanus TaxID=154827 RepID=UPI002241F6F5|nr:protein cornichon homolog 4-like [Xyrauchen texanus]
MEAAVFIFSLVDCCALIFLSVYFIITLSDLECDYINARACCSKLNKWVIPEMIGQALATVLMLVSMHWFVFLLNLPVSSWNVYRYVKVPMGNMGVYDPTEIHNRGQLKSHMKEAMIKLGFHLLCFFIYLYRMTKVHNLQGFRGSVHLLVGLQDGWGVEMMKLSPFTIHKGITGMATNVKEVKKLQSGQILVECCRKSSSENRLRSNWAGFDIKMSPHPTLNYSKRSDSYRDLDDVEEITSVLNLKE